MMAALRIFLLCALYACAHAYNVTVEHQNMTLTLESQVTGGFLVKLLQAGTQLYANTIGRSLVSTNVTSSEEIEGGVALQIEAAELSVQAMFDEAANARGLRISWNSGNDTTFQDCIDFGSKYWYGGPMQIRQVFPIETSTVVGMGYVSKERDNGAIIERYWLNSAGEYIYINPQVPLFVDYNNTLSNHVCFKAEIATPYSTIRNHTELSYDLWFLTDVKSAHKHALANYLGKPSGVPDFTMVKYPIWSTWAEFGRDIDETNILEYARQIKEYGFENSQLEIDDRWEVCYGSLTVNENKFSNFTKLVQDIKALGYRVTIWVHPFINKNCEPWYTEALNSSYLVLNENGSPDTSWWNSNGTVGSYVDFTNPAAAEWWYQRVKNIVDTYGIDSLKFDAGESSFSPQIPVQTGDADMHPHHITQAYVRTCARFGDMIEVRTGFKTQDLPIFVRMVDRDSAWGLTNGLSTIITTTFQMNLNGYTLVLADMIGGNGFNLANENSALPTKQLFIRWVQANTFLPAMQFSFVPWGFDNETAEISRKYTELHAQYAQTIYNAMNASTIDGRPVNGPLWWIAPNDNVTWTIWDQYLLGEDIIVAPVLVENATSRNIYLPEGEWLAKGSANEAYTGPIWLTDYPAPIDELPYFVRKGVTSEPDAASTPHVAAILVAVAIFVGVFNEY